MKYKHIIFISLLFLCMPIIANADVALSKCSVISGSLTTIGSEVACGNEHFYIIENNNGNIKMMAKYNLYVGANFDKITVDINSTYVETEYTSSNYLHPGTSNSYYENEEVSNYEEIKTRLKTRYNLDNIYSFINIYNAFSDGTSNNALYSEVSSGNYTRDGKYYRRYTYKLYPYTSLVEGVNGYGLQNELAIGVHGEKGNAVYPIYATVAIFPGFNENMSVNDFYNPYNVTENYDNFENGYLNFDFKNGYFVQNYLDTYKTKLNNMGYAVTDVDMINMQELNNLVHAISNQNLPLAQWTAESNNYIEGGDFNNYTKIGSLKDYLSDDYSWIWNTTYWTKTLVGNELNDINMDLPAYFVTTEGDICYSYSQCQGLPRAGIRPIVTVSINDVIDPFNIATQTEGSGTVEVVDKAMANEQITFRAIPEKNYKIKYVIVTDKLGNSITFKEDQLIQNADGTISINSFTMPSSDVVIKVGFELVNPKTGVSNPIWIMILGLIVSGLAYYELNKNSQTNMEL